MDYLTHLADDHFLTMMVICGVLIMAGAGIAAKFDSRWGYVIMLIPAAFVAYALRVQGLY